MNIISIIISSFVRRLAFLILRQGFLGFQWIWYEFRGINNRRRLVARPEYYHVSAEVLKIQARNVFCTSDLNTRSDFIVTHESFTTPEYVLEKDSISLFILDKSWVVFCDSDHEEPLWDMKYNDFYRNAAFFKAKMLVVMPMSSFVRLAESMDLPKSEVLFIGSTARSGSTLLAHMMHNTGRCAVMSEPECLNCLAQMIHRYQLHNENQIKSVLLSTIKFLCKPLKTSPPKSYVLKLAVPVSKLESAIRRHFPQGKHMFLYRNMPDSACSIMAVASMFPSVYLTIKLHEYGKLGRIFGDRFLVPNNPLGIPYKGIREWATWVWMTNVKYYLSHAHDGKTPAFRYEELVSYPQEVLTDIFSHIQLDLGFINKAVTALEVDSQQNSPMIVVKLASRMRRNDVIPTCEKMLLVAELPSLAECDILPGTRCVYKTLSFK